MCTMEDLVSVDALRTKLKTAERMRSLLISGFSSARHSRSPFFSFLWLLWRTRFLLYLPLRKASQQRDTSTMSSRFTSSWFNSCPSFSSSEFTIANAVYLSIYTYLELRRCALEWNPFTTCFLLLM